MAESQSIVNSALWAAYGDALGFITELADAKGVKRRIKNSKVSHTVPWKRSVGGKFGAVADLPEGAYSDDTQLRLATSRAICGDGHFDVEAFAKVELTVWPTYSLGGGISTKAAANSLSNPNIAWFSNFFESKQARYVDAGGNGAAMRIQPLVWAASDLKSPARLLPPIIRNTICSHGHPRAIAGAVFHAMCLSSALETRSVPGPREWYAFVETLLHLPELIRQDGDLRAFWIPTWEDRSHSTLEAAFKSIKGEMLSKIQLGESRLYDKGYEAYEELVTSLDATSHEVRGSGTKTAIIAACLAFMFHSRPVEQALITAANLLGSDTDTIATMTGAIMGAVAAEAPKGALQDRDYIREEALRLHAVSLGRKTRSFRYPDLLEWRPPRTQLDGVISEGGLFSLSGLGNARPIGSKYSARTGGAAWQWLKLDFGQTVLAKQRNKMKSDTFATQRIPEDKEGSSSGKSDKSRQDQAFLFSNTSPTGAARKLSSVDELTTEAIRSGFDPRLIGDHMLMLAERPEGIELAMAYSAIIAKARRARMEASRRARS